MNWSGPPILAVQSPNAPTPTHKATGSTADATTRCTPRRTAAKLFWSATVYDADTRCLIDNEQQRGDRGSRDQELLYNHDGSVDLHFGPARRAGREANWVQTIPDRHWFSYFRLYGPLEAYFDRSWKLGYITPDTV